MGKVHASLLYNDKHRDIKKLGNAIHIVYSTVLITVAILYIISLFNHLE